MGRNERVHRYTVVVLKIFRKKVTEADQAQYKDDKISPVRTKSPPRVERLSSRNRYLCWGIYISYNSFMVIYELEKPNKSRTISTLSLILMDFDRYFYSNNSKILLCAIYYN